MVAPLCLGITLPSSGSVPSAVYVLAVNVLAANVLAVYILAVYVHTHKAEREPILKHFPKKLNS
jgi:hypothetical protein